MALFFLFIHLSLLIRTRLIKFLFMKKKLQLLKWTIVAVFFFGMKPAAHATNPPLALTVSTPLCFKNMDNNPLYDQDLTLGQITVSSLLIQNGGSISYNDPGNPCSDAGIPNDPAGSVTIIVLGNMEIQAGGFINTENKYQAGNGGNITITVGGTFMMRGPSAPLAGACISSSNLSATAGGINAGNITIHVTGNVDMEPGSTVKGNSYKGRGGTIDIAGINDIHIDGNVLSQSTASGSGCNPGYGGYISISAKKNLLISDAGVVSSSGRDPGADLVHLCACNVTIYGLVESTGSGHAIPTCPVTHLVPPNRPDKPTNSTAGVEIWAGSSIIINNVLPHKGEIKADLCCAGGTQGTSWIDIFARGDISIVGNTNAAFAVHANGASGNTDNGGMVTIKSIAGKVSTVGRATQTNGTAFGGLTTIEAKKDVDLTNGNNESKGSAAAGKNGGTINVRSWGTAPNTGSILSNVSSVLCVTGGSPANGVINLKACGTIGFPTGSIVPATIVPSKITGACNGSPELPHGVEQPTYVEFCECGEQSCVCIVCGQPNNVIEVNENVTVNFNGPGDPVYSGDPDLLPYFFWDNSDPDPSNWKAIFNMGSKKLLVKEGATITVINVPDNTNNQKAPGIVINSTCEIEVEYGGHIIVNSVNKNAGDIIINCYGHIIINGEVRDEVSGTNGLPGAITITSKCGDISVGPDGRIFDLGVDPGGNLITLQTCGAFSLQGDITVNGLVKAFAHAHVEPLTEHRPSIKVLSWNGAVTINANTVDPLYDDLVVAGTEFDLYGGLLAWVRDNVNPGKVEVQARRDITVNGHGVDPSGPVRQSFGAIAAISTRSDAPGGLVDVRSLEGNIIGNDRAFDVSGRNRLATNFAHINLAAALNITLNRLGADNTFNPVVDASSPSIGDNGGRNDIRSFMGTVNKGVNSLISAAVPVGQGSVQGINNLVSCGGVFGPGVVNPSDAFPLDNNGVCNVNNPPALFGNPCQGFNPCQGGQIEEIENTDGFDYNSTIVAPGKTTLLQAYPNPSTNMTTIRYMVANDGNVQLKVFGISGKEVANLVNGRQVQGEHSFQWNASGLPAGVYLIQLKTGNITGTYKLMLIK
jgi:hypothetical protein